ncbi:MAG: hypothetical protein JWP12_2590 [Bacteroidetes bacterium]|nr:hypothetical protein [Bacteroidota bacterium]
MSTLKHKLFLIPIEEGEININDKALQEINVFLANENMIYLNHSISVTSKDEYITNTPFKFEQITSSPEMDRFFKYKNINVYCVISLVYRDLSNTENDLSKLSSKSKKVVKELVQSVKKIPKPNI